MSDTGEATQHLATQPREPASDWEVTGVATAHFSSDYSGGRRELVKLYEKGKVRQWNATTRIDWTIDVDPANPLGVSEESIPIAASATWRRLGTTDRETVVRHLAAWQFSQFLHGEQSGLLCLGGLIAAVPSLDSKLFAATQIVDEARHAETYARFLNEKVGLIYPLTSALRSLFGDIAADSRWDMKYLGIQVIVEGMALAAFGVVRDTASNQLARAINAYVMEDEARHVAFGRIALREVYADVTESERAEREEFCIAAFELMRQRMRAEDVWTTLGFDVAECVDAMENSSVQRALQRLMMARVVPVLRDIGIAGPRLIAYLAEHDASDLLATDSERMGRADELSARIADAQRERDIARVADAAGES